MEIFFSFILPIAMSHVQTEKKSQDKKLASPIMFFF